MEGRNAVNHLLNITGKKHQKRFLTAYIQVDIYFVHYISNINHTHNTHDIHNTHNTLPIYQFVPIPVVSCDPGNMTFRGQVRPKVISNLNLPTDLDPRMGIQCTRLMKHNLRNFIYMLK